MAPRLGKRGFLWWCELVSPVVEDEVSTAQQQSVKDAVTVQ